MDIGRAFTSPVKDPKWLKKVAIAVLVSWVPIVNLALSGWGIGYLKNCFEGRAEALPEWGDFGTHWTRGALFAFASLIYYSPVLVIVVVFGLPAGALTSTQNMNLDGLNAALGSMLVGLVVALLFAVLVSVLAQAARTHYAVHGGFSAAFGLKGIYGAVKRNAAGYFLAWIVGILAVWGASAVGGFAGGTVGAIPVIGWGATILVLPLVTGVGVFAGLGANGLFGQYAAGAYLVNPDSRVRMSPEGHTALVATLAPGNPKSETGMLPPSAVIESGLDGMGAGATIPPGLAGRAAVAAALAALGGPAQAAVAPLPVVASEPEPEPEPEPLPVEPVVAGLKSSRRVSLRRESGPGRVGEMWLVPQGATRIGRDDHCLIVLEDSKASRVHAHISLTLDQMTLADGGSSNGTSLNGTTIGQWPVQVRSGDGVRIGDTILVVTFED